MFYVVTKLNPMYHQMSLEELLFSDDKDIFVFENNKYSSTRTYEYEVIPEKILKRISVEYLINVLKTFNDTNKDLIAREKSELYRTFHIPEKSGGLREINAPNPELMGALHELKRIFEDKFFAMYHTSAFAYIKNRSVVDAVKRHQINESKWFAKFDLSNFFGSTTPEYVMHMLSMVFPFSEVIKNEAGKAELEKALSLAFLNGGLPQGTPISPLITNLIMIPVDYILFNKLRKYNEKKYVYTRYADDFIISCKIAFDHKEIEKLIIDCLAAFGAPFSIKKEKTRYGSSSGSNWNLGIMLNKDNNMTIGYRNKRKFTAMLFSYAKDRINGTKWEFHDIKILDGYRNWYSMIEKESIQNIINKINKKLNVNIVDMMKEDLRP